MGFFDDLPPPPPPTPPPPLEQMPWMGPPPGWVGGWVPWHIVVMRNSKVYVVLTDVQAFPTGVLFALKAWVRPGAFGRDHGPPESPLITPMGSDGLLFGIGFADGRKAALHQPFPSPGAEPGGPVLTPFGGGGSGAQEQMVIWLWPLPPEGPLSLVAAWPRGGIEETTITVDAAELVSAASNAEELWPDETASDGWWGVWRSIEIRDDPEAEGPQRDE